MNVAFILTLTLCSRCAIVAIILCIFCAYDVRFSRRARIRCSLRSVFGQSAIREFANLLLVLRYTRFGVSAIVCVCVFVGLCVCV